MMREEFSAADMPSGVIRCSEAQAALHAYVDGEFGLLANVTAAELSDHVRACSLCASFLGQLKALKQRLACSCGCAPPADLRTRVITRITQMYADGDTFAYSDEIRVEDF
jgi:anti-sigma factor (TIGR02949 family)